MIEKYGRRRIVTGLTNFIDFLFHVEVEMWFFQPEIS